MSGHGTLSAGQAGRPEVGSPFALLLDRSQAGARLRTAALALGLGFYWFLVTFLSDFPALLPASVLQGFPPLLAVMLDALTAFFAPPVLVYLLPALAAVGLAFYGAALYLADLYELESPFIALHYLVGSVLGLSYPSLAVHSGRIADLDQRNPLLRIGGPGYLILHMGFCAVFETPEGQPRIYGPARGGLGRPIFVSGFERVKEVVDLRDQLRRLDEVKTTTRDGIDVYARDVQMVFRVSSSEKRSMQHPYPFDPKSILSLVYGRVMDEAGPGRWTDWLPDLARAELRRFVAQRTLGEFLAMRGEGEVETEGAGPSMHIPRRQLAESFHTAERQARLKEAGLELVWVGVGTWEVRDDQIPSSDSELAAGRTLTATLRNQARARRLKSPDHLSQTRLAASLAFSRDTLLELSQSWSQAQLPAEYNCFEVLERFRRRLIEIKRRVEDGESGISTGELELPEGYVEVLLHLETLTDRSPSF